GEWNQRVFETLACGALLFQEAGNAEVGTKLADRRECVFYTNEDLESRLQYYLEHEDARRALAEAGRRRAREFTFGALWRGQLAALLRHWDSLAARARSRPALSDLDQLSARAFQAQTTMPGGDPQLIADLTAALDKRPSAALHNLVGLVRAVNHPGQRDELSKSAQAFQRAWG